MRVSIKSKINYCIKSAYKYWQVFTEIKYYKC